MSLIHAPRIHMLHGYMTRRETMDLLLSVPVIMMNFLSYRKKEDHVDQLLQCSFASQESFSCAVIK